MISKQGDMYVINFNGMTVVMSRDKLLNFFDELQEIIEQTDDNSR
jgi:hypothetical protein